MELRSNSKVGEIAAASMASIRVLEDFGIDYCWGGEQSITEACRSAGVDPEGLLQAIGDTMLSTAPGTRDWKAEPLAALICHIVSVHHEYLRLELPRIQKRLAVVYATYRQRDASTLAPLPEIVFLLKGELEVHMHKEERMLFPAIEESERAARGANRPPFPFGRFANPINIMLAEHESAGASLDRIRKITRNYERWDIYFTQVGPIYCGRRRQSLRSTSPSTCTSLVPRPRLARRDARRASLGYANFVG